MQVSPASQGLIHIRSREPGYDTVPNIFPFEGSLCNVESLRNFIHSSLQLSTHVEVVLYNTQDQILSYSSVLSSYSVVSYELRRLTPEQYASKIANENAVDLSALLIPDLDLFGKNQERQSNFKIFKISDAARLLSVIKYQSASNFKTGEIVTIASEKSLEDASQPSNTVRTLLDKDTKESSEKKLSVPDHLRCELCTFIYSNPRQTNCCNFCGCDSCLLFSFAYFRRCPKCDTKQFDLRLQEAPSELQKELKSFTIQSSTCLQEDHPENLTINAACSTISKDTQTTRNSVQKERNVIVSRDFFDSLKSLDYLVESRKRVRAEKSNFDWSAEETALLHRVRQAKEGRAQMPVLNEYQRRKFSKYL